jgi:hypothetical protein
MIWTPLFRSTDLTESSVVDFVIFFTCSQNLTGIAQACRKHTVVPPRRHRANCNPMHPIPITSSKRARCPEERRGLRASYQRCGWDQ